MEKILNIAIVSHDRRKEDMIEWARHNVEFLCKHNLYCTGTTGGLVKKMFQEENCSGRNVTCYKSGPVGGDLEIGAMVVNGNINFCIFLIDDLNPNPHESDIQALLRQCRIHNVPVACNRHSADLMITSTLWDEDYKPTKPKYANFKREG